MCDCDCELPKHEKWEQIKRQHAHDLAEEIRTHDVDYLGAYHGGWLDAADLIDPEVS